MKVAQSCLIFFDPVDYTVHGILKARILEWVTVPFSRGSSQLRDLTQVSCIAGRVLKNSATREAHVCGGTDINEHFAQTVKNLPGVQETWVHPLGWEDPLEKEMVTHSSILAWEISWTEVHRVTKSKTQLETKQQQA